MATEQLQCKYCDTKFNAPRYGNYSVRCPYCYRSLLHISDYGFGPITPFYICVGSEVAGVVECRNHDYELKFRGRVIPLKKTYMEAVDEAEEHIVNSLGIQIKEVELPIITKEGSLFFYGESFGRPYDNVHKIKSVRYDGELLVIVFDKWEELFVYHPKDIESTEKELRIGSAAKVKWSYIPYGGQGQQSRKTYSYQRNYQKIWKMNEQGKREMQVEESTPAVLLVGH